MNACRTTAGLLLAFAALLPSSLAIAQEQTSSDDAAAINASARVFDLMLPSEHLFGDWGGVRSTLEDAGITPRLILVTDLAGNPIGGRSQGVTAPTSTELSLYFDLERIAGLRGGSIFTSFSYRWGDSLSREHIGNVFSAQQIYGFQTFRVIDVSYQQSLFNDRVELRLGRFAATDDFLVSAYNAGMVSNAFCGNPFGILLNTQGMTAYTGTWAARIKARPTPRSYVMVGVYNGDPDIRADRYHGVNLSLDGPLFALAEVGFQVNGLPGDDQRVGNYKLGVWYDDATFTDFNSGAEVDGSWGAYALFDQVLAPFGEPGSNRGLGVFGSVTVALDPDVQQMPVFVTTGLSARGIFDARPRDTLSIGVAFGEFSDDLRRAQQDGRLTGPLGGQDGEMVVEATYRFDFGDGAFFVQPDIQYIRKPGGDRDLDDALVLGAQIGVNF